MVVGASGKTVVEANIGDYVNYYVTCTKADNHAVRESSCQCIAELAAKIDYDIILPHVNTLRDALIECFADESWPVRDMACVASGSFVLCFPEQSKRALTKLLPLFCTNLKDPISSVRQGGALAISKTLKAYKVPGDLNDQCKVLIAEALDGVEKQPVESQKYGDLSTENATFGVVKRLRDNDPDLHENQTMYSCGSLAPKMGRSSASAGCGDCKFKKPSEPWEAADGCLFLMSELSTLPECHEMVASMLSKASKAARQKHYTMHYCFLETLCKVLPTIGKGIGKRLFKPHLEDFFDAIFYARESDNSLASSAAEQCLSRLSEFLGPNILRGRIEQYNPRYLALLDAKGGFDSMAMASGFNPIMAGAEAPFSPPPYGVTYRPGASAPMAIPTKPSLGGTPTGSPK